MKHSVFVGCIGILLFLFTACKKEEKPLLLVMSEPNPAGSLSAEMDKVFKEKVEELSGGTISIQLYTDAVLGDNTAVMKVMTQPDTTIHIARLSPAALVSYDCDKHELLDAPFTFSSHEHFWKFAASPAAQSILNEPYEKNIGVKGLFFAEEGFRHFFSTKRLTGIEDFAGEKIRTAGNAMMTGIANALQGEPVSVSFSNLYTALQIGDVDIAEQPIANYLSNHFNKVAPYMILDGHVLGVSEVIISAKIWDSLSKKQQEILLAAAKSASEYCSQASLGAETEARLALQNEGAEFVAVNDISVWQKACADVINDVVKINAELYEEIQLLAK